MSVGLFEGFRTTSRRIGTAALAFDRMVDRLQVALVERDTLVEQLRSREAAMRRFVADASHELRTPLTAIRGGAQVLGLGALSDPDDLAESLGHIRTQTERMSRLVDDLLLLSRQEAGQPGRRKELMDLGMVVTDQAEQWRTLAGHHPVVVEAETVWVVADLEALARAVSSLVDNAGKYSPPRAPITIRLTRSDSLAELSVSDEGPGIPTAERSRIFERFYRGDPARTRATGGAGLGLAIVASIIGDAVMMQI